MSESLSATLPLASAGKCSKHFITGIRSRGERKKRKREREREYVCMRMFASPC